MGIRQNRQKNPDFSNQIFQKSIGDGSVCIHPPFRYARIEKIDFVVSLLQQKQVRKFLDKILQFGPQFAEQTKCCVAKIYQQYPVKVIGMSFRLFKYVDFQEKSGEKKIVSPLYIFSYLIFHTRNQDLRSCFQNSRCGGQWIQNS